MQQDFGSPIKRHLFDVRVFNPLAGRYWDIKIEKSHEINEKEKKRSYNERVLQIEHGSFTPLVFCSNGGKGRECQKFYQRLGQLISEKRGMRNNIVMNWINRNLSFAPNLCVIMCIRGSQANNNKTSAD